MNQSTPNSTYRGKKSFVVIFLLTSCISFCIWQCGPGLTGNTTNYGPLDAADSFPLTQTSFNSWFASNSVTPNGLVIPANSLSFNAFPNAGYNNPNPAFYKWATQMFLWITSGASANGAGDSTVLASPTFFTVTPADSNGSRTLVPHVIGTPLTAVSNIRDAKLVGGKRLITDRKGKKFLIDNKKGGHTTVLDETGKEVAIKNIVAKTGGGHSFIGPDAKEIKVHKPIFSSTAQKFPLAALFTSAAGKSVLLDAAGNEIDSEEGQASGDALISKNGSLVYFITMVNDVYVKFLDTVNSNSALGNVFPTTQGELNNIYGSTPQPQDAMALAMELKTSWVTSLSLGADSVNYVRITANVPFFDTTNPNQWNRKNSIIPTRLALVGMHVVGSAQGHPEMIWATFEHQNNTPNAGFSYLDTTGAVKYFPQNNSGNWVFSSNAADPSPNVSHISAPDGVSYITSTTGFTISPSNTLRINPAGSFNIISPNPFDSPASSNSEIISLNNRIQKMLAAGDIRKNYFLVGATWTGGLSATSGGVAPNGNSYQGINTPQNDSLAYGTSQLANSTMETYVLPINYTNSNNTFGTNMSCFACHSGNSLQPNFLSHVFAEITPLPLGQTTASKLKSAGK